MKHTWSHKIWFCENGREKPQCNASNHVPVAYTKIFTIQRHFIIPITQMYRSDVDDIISIFWHGIVNLRKLHRSFGNSCYKRVNLSLNEPIYRENIASSSRPKKELNITSGDKTAKPEHGKSTCSTVNFHITLSPKAAIKNLAVLPAAWYHGHLENVQESSQSGSCSGSRFVSF